MSTVLSRRQVNLAAAWSAPVVVLGAAAPALASSAEPVTSGLAVEVADPPLDSTGWAYQRSVPVRGGSITGRVRTHGALPERVTLRNLGPTAATNPTGLMYVDMLDYTGVRPAGGYAQVKVGSPDTRWALTEVSGSNRGTDYTWIFQGTLAPGASVELPMSYYVRSPFSNVASQFNVLVGVSVVDAVADDRDDLSERMGLVPPFDYFF